MVHEEARVWFGQAIFVDSGAFLVYPHVVEEAKGLSQISLQGFMIYLVTSLKPPNTIWE